MGEDALAPVPRRHRRHAARDEAFHFIRLGTHLERADNTARILDVKYHTLLPERRRTSAAPSTTTSGARFCAPSPGFEAYRKIYSDVITPRRVAELLILRDDMPRSLHACMNFIHGTLERLCDAHSREIERAAGELYSKLRYGRTDDIIRFGLHEYLMDSSSGSPCSATRSAATSSSRRDGGDRVQFSEREATSRDSVRFALFALAAAR
jgi:uncharacterized alpha-E superfamily protein